MVKPASLSPQASEIIADETNTILVCAASAWEISTKVRLNKLPEAIELERDFINAMNKAGYTLIPIDAESGLRAGRFTSNHRDPFDRIIAARALTDGVPLISADGRMDSFGVQRIW